MLMTIILNLQFPFSLLKCVLFSNQSPIGAEIYYFYYYFLDVLGNSYLSCFFLAGQSPNDLKQSMVAYSRAVRSF